MKEASRAEVKEKFSHEEYPVHVIGRHVNITEAMKAYAVDKLTARLKRYGARVIEATVTMDIQWIQQTVDFIININDIKIKVSGKSENMYNSVDFAIEHLDAKLTRYLRRIHEHRAPKVQDIEMHVNVVRPDTLTDINDQIEEQNLKEQEQLFTKHRIVSREKRVLQHLSSNEALMKIELSGDAFLIYHGEEDRKLKVIYRRNDGNYGIIEAGK